MLTRGFTLIEMILTLTALALVLQGWYAWKNARLVEAAIERTVDGFVLIDEAAYAFHVEQGRWPNNLSELRSTSPPLLPPVPSGGMDPLVNGVGGLYALGPRLGGGIEVQTTMLNDVLAGRVQRAFPHRTRLPTPPGGGVVIFEQTAAPKDQTDHELLVWRDGTRDMEAPLPFDATVSVIDGSACAGKGIATSTNGTLFECVSSAWRAVGTAAATSTGGLSCGWTGWRILDVFEEEKATITGRGGYWEKTGNALGYLCSGGEVTQVDRAFCRKTESIHSGGVDWRRFRFAVSDCSF